MKINKQKPHWKWSREKSHTRVTRHTLLSSTGSGLHFQGMQYYIQYNTQEVIPHCYPGWGWRKDSPYPSNSSAQGRLPLLGHCKSLHFKLLVPSNGLSVYNSPSQGHQRASLSFVSLDLCVVHPQNARPALQFFVFPK